MLVANGGLKSTMVVPFVCDKSQQSGKFSVFGHPFQMEAQRLMKKMVLGPRAKRHVTRKSSVSSLAVGFSIHTTMVIKVGLPLFGVWGRCL